MKQKMKFNSQRSSANYSKGTERGMNSLNSKLKNNFMPSRTTQSKGQTPSPISNRFQQASVNNSLSLNNYKNQTQLLQASKGIKPISVNRKGKSLDYSHNESSLNESKMSTLSIYKIKANKIGLRSVTPNLSKPSMKRLNMSEINQSIKSNSIQTSIAIKNKILLKSTSPIFKPSKGNNKLTHGVFSTKNIFGNFIKKKPPTQSSCKKINNVSFTHQSNYSQIMSQKKHLEIATSINQHHIKNKDKDKDKATTSSDTLITKEMTPKIQRLESPLNKVVKSKKIIKCMHDLSKTGLSGDEKKVNQDTYFIFKNFSNHWDYIYMGVW